MDERIADTLGVNDAAMISLMGVPQPVAATVVTHQLLVEKPLPASKSLYNVWPLHATARTMNRRSPPARDCPAIHRAATTAARDHQEFDVIFSSPS
jgi:hypothetical protein